MDQPYHLRRASLLSETSPTTAPQIKDGFTIRYWLAHGIGAVGLFRSPNLSTATPMIPVTGLDAGAGKAGLIQSSATCPAGLECRKVLLTQGVTTIPLPIIRFFPESKTACDFDAGAHDSIVTAGSIWAFWGRWESVEFVSHRNDSVHRNRARQRPDMLCQDQPLHSIFASVAAHSAELEWLRLPARTGLAQD